MISSGLSAVRVGIDVGGTFTDIVLTDDQGRVFTHKLPSTPADLSRGSVLGMKELLERRQLSADAVGAIVHATTTATNAVLEGKGARTGLITTAGFRDVLEFRRVRVPELYNLGYVKPLPLVPRQWRLEVDERMGPKGEVWRPLDDESVRSAAIRMRDGGMQAIAICLLHSYANPSHEKRVRDIVKDVVGGSVFVCCSHEILPEFREYERTSTTVVNAYLGPVMEDYLHRLEARLVEIGAGRSLHVMTSSGGQLGLRAARQKPAYLVESGPAAGVIAAARIAEKAGLANVITLDMGGTTAKTAIVENATPAKTSEFEVGAGVNLSSKLVRGAGYAIKLPFIDVSEIGAGGGSIIRFDRGGALKVGPDSAGAEPGPVCYGKGGKAATLTDAFLMLGFLNPDYLVGGELMIDAVAARKAMEEQVAVPLSKPVHEAAHGAVTVAVANMVRAVKSVSTYRGRDPRDYTLIGFGGNGPIVASMIARELSIPRVLIPPRSGVLSAAGLLMADHEQESVRSFPGLTSEIKPEILERAYEELSEEAIALLCTEGFTRDVVEVSRFADLRYVGQAYELTVPAPGRIVKDLSEIEDSFHIEHKKNYSHMSFNEPVALVSIRVVARVRSPITKNEPKANTAFSLTHDQTLKPRNVYFGEGLGFGLRLTPVIRRADLTKKRQGPLIVEEYDSTCVVPPDAAALVDQWDNIVITFEATP